MRLQVFLFALLFFDARLFCPQFHPYRVGTDTLALGRFDRRLFVRLQKREDGRPRAKHFSVLRGLFCRILAL